MLRNSFFFLVRNVLTITSQDEPTHSTISQIIGGTTISSVKTP